MYARIDTVGDMEILADVDLVRLLKRGNDEAMEVLLRRHSDALYRFCCHLMHNREDAEDICQESLARAITRVDALQIGGAFRSWLFSIARNLSVDSYRSKKRTCSMPEEEAMPLQLYGETPHDRIEVSEEHQTVAEALNKLAQSHQKVLVLREIDGLSYAAIAQKMNVSQSAVETLLFRARRRLREEYGKSALPVFAFLGAVKDVAARIALPAAGGSAIAKVALSSSVLGGTLVGAPHMTPAVPATHRASATRLATGPVANRSVATTRYAPSVPVSVALRSAPLTKVRAQAWVRAAPVTSPRVVPAQLALHHNSLPYRAPRGAQPAQRTAAAPAAVNSGAQFVPTTASHAFAPQSAPPATQSVPAASIPQPSTVDQHAMSPQSGVAPSAYTPAVATSAVMQPSVTAAATSGRYSFTQAPSTTISPQASSAPSWTTRLEGGQAPNSVPTPQSGQATNTQGPSPEYQGDGHTDQTTSPAPESTTRGD